MKRKAGQYLGWTLTLGCLSLAAVLHADTKSEPAKNTPKPPTTAPATRPAEEDVSVWIMKILKEHQPELYQKAEALRNSDPKRFEKMLQEAAPNFNQLKDLQKRDPEMFRLRMEDLKLSYQTVQLARRYHDPSTTVGDKAELVEQITNTVNAQFDVRADIRQREIDDIVKKVEALRKDLAERNKKQVEEVKKRVREITSRMPNLNW
ncbi:MAG: hypothetical protein WCJ97_09670 [Phycisphaerae bacterium]